METVNWKVEGMSCSGCAQSIDSFLQKKGMEQVSVSLVSGNVSFRKNGQVTENELKKGIQGLGYQVAEETEQPGRKPINKFLRYLLLCAPFTILLLLPMIGPLHLHWLMNAWVQLFLCIPVYIAGMFFFGRSAINSLRNRRPNMNVLIALGASAAFVYSLTGTLLHLGEGYLFYETAALIITLVFAGNYIEERAIRSTQSALNGLALSQKTTATMIAFDDQHQEILFPVASKQLRSGDLILIRSGEEVPTDCKILSGEAQINESILTGESLPVFKKAKDLLMGGSLVTDGVLKAQVTASPKNATLSRIVDLVQRAQADKPPVQLLADRISMIFVPVVIGIALVTFGVNYFVLRDFTPALMRAIAVLVIACPCAMGLATPAAIAVGLGRAARNGILFRDASGLERFKDIRQVVFDKTGTLTTGEFRLARWKVVAAAMPEETFRKIVFSLEKYSNHPIAKSVITAWKGNGEVKLTEVREIKGAGVQAIHSGAEYRIGSYAFAGEGGSDKAHNLYLSKSGELLGWIDVEDELRPEAAAVVQYFRKKDIRTILLSGDRLEKCQQIATALQLDEVIAERSPAQKLAEIERLNAASPTAMIGDGINDAPALARASIGISMSDASQIALQTADVVLMNSGMRNFPLSLALGKNTYLTIRQNLFWAFIYNVIAIPVAAFGFLTPAVGALAMAFSDVILLINSSRLFVKKLL
jgi:P-type Cu+ transporter